MGTAIPDVIQLGAFVWFEKTQGPVVIDGAGCFWTAANKEKKVCYFRVVSARKTTVRLLNVPRQTVSDTICRFKEFGNDGRRPGIGQKRTINTSKNRKAIEKRVQRNPRVSMRQITRGMGISDRSVRQIAKMKLGLKPYKLRKVQLLTEKKTRAAPKIPKTFETGRKSALGKIPFH
ncbi:uncharacterized protein TNCV_3614611 [Trichonephila clavipes]|uniref:Transposase Tc1-like domain-containing protein n=1 Tax=Trichonephila clavipes TaxID=2585209 RepID=A0A8X6VMZ6_TRICX|nr:uncharacterized protein TNCV_3614611 [Trichonephila clavipes]